LLIQSLTESEVCEKLRSNIIGVQQKAFAHLDVRGEYPASGQEVINVHPSQGATYIKVRKNKNKLYTNMPKYILETQNSFCDGLMTLMKSGESIRFFAPLVGGQRVKDFTANPDASCVGLHVGINEAGRQGLICFYFVEFPKADAKEFKSGIVLLSLIREKEQLATLFNPNKLASLLKTDEACAREIVENLKKDFLSFERLKMMYGIYELMKK
jgi:molybdopterin converting factor small subunit